MKMNDNEMTLTGDMKKPPRPRNDGEEALFINLSFYFCFLLRLIHQMIHPMTMMTRMTYTTME